MPTMADFDCPQCGRTAHREAYKLRVAREKGHKIYCSFECSAIGRKTRTPEQRAAYCLAYRQARREELRQKAKEYRHGENRGKVLASQRESYLRNREKNLARMREYREANKEAQLQRVKAWRLTNPDKALFHDAKAHLATKHGLKYRDIPDDLAWAQMNYWLILRAAKAMSASGQDQNGLGAQPASAVGETDLP